MLLIYIIIQRPGRAARPQFCLAPPTSPNPAPGPRPRPRPAWSLVHMGTITTQIAEVSILVKTRSTKGSWEMVYACQCQVEVPHLAPLVSESYINMTLKRYIFSNYLEKFCLYRHRQKPEKRVFSKGTTPAWHRVKTRLCPKMLQT